MNLVAELKTAFLETYVWFDKKLGAKRVATTLGAALVLGGAWYGYTWHYKRIEMCAQKDYAHLLEDWQKAIKAKEDSLPLWQQISHDADRYSNEHSSSTLSPFFTFLYAQSILYQNASQDTVAQALEQAGQALQKTSTTNPYYALMQLNYALMLLDGTDQDKTNGTQILASISVDQDSVYSKAASQALAAYTRST